MYKIGDTFTYTNVFGAAEKLMFCLVDADTDEETDTCVYTLSLITSTGNRWCDPVYYRTTAEKSILDTGVSPEWFTENMDRYEKLSRVRTLV